MFSHVKISSDQVTGVQRNYNVIQNSKNQYLVLPRQLKWENKRIQQKLYLISGESKIGGSILNSVHIHCASIPTMLSSIYEKGFYIMGARKILKKKQESCNECKRIRLQVCERLMGPSFQELSHYKHLPVWAAKHFDIAGPMKQKITRKQSGTCSYVLV